MIDVLKLYLKALLDSFTWHEWLSQCQAMRVYNKKLLGRASVECKRCAGQQVFKRLLDRLARSAAIHLQVSRLFESARLRLSQVWSSSVCIVCIHFTSGAFWGSSWALRCRGVLLLLLKYSPQQTHLLWFLAVASGARGARLSSLIVAGRQALIAQKPRPDNSDIEGSSDKLEADEPDWECPIPFFT